VICLCVCFLGDILRVPVVRLTVRETTALGAAYLAGLAVGFWKSPKSISSHWQVEKTFTPRMPRAQAAGLRARWQDALARAKDWEPAAAPKKSR
jgi:glycerol kinase